MPKQNMPVPERGKTSCASKYIEVPHGIDIRLKIRSLDQLKLGEVGMALAQFFVTFCYENELSANEMVSCAETMLADSKTAWEFIDLDDD